MPDLLDFTKRRLGSVAENGRRIVKCPKCGRKATCSKYNNGHAMYVHTAENLGIGLGVREKCFVKES